MSSISVIERSSNTINNVVFHKDLSRQDRASSVLTALIAPFYCMKNTIFKIIKLFSLNHFWCNKPDEKAYSLKKRFIEAGKDLLNIVLAPICLIAIETFAIYTTFSPNN